MRVRCLSVGHWLLAAVVVDVASCTRILPPRPLALAPQPHPSAAAPLMPSAAGAPMRAFDGLAASLATPQAAVADRLDRTSRLSSGIRRVHKAAPQRASAAEFRKEKAPRGFGDTAAIRVTKMGSGRGSFLLEMGGQRLLFNPTLQDCDELSPQDVDKRVDFVIITSGSDEFINYETISAMKLTKTNFVVVKAAADKLSTMMILNMATIEPGPEGQLMLEGTDGKLDLALFTVPGKSVMPWDTPECGVILINMVSGVAVGYEGYGQYVGPGASSTQEGIPEAAYQIDYLITPSLREASGVVKGLTERGAALRGIVHLQTSGEGGEETEKDANPLLAPFMAVDKTLDQTLGGSGVGDDAAEFIEFLQSQGHPLSEARLIQPSMGSAAATLEE